MKEKGLEAIKTIARERNTIAKRHTLFKDDKIDYSFDVKRKHVLNLVWRLNRKHFPRIQRHVEKKFLDRYIAEQTDPVYAQQIRDAYQERINRLDKEKPEELVEPEEPFRQKVEPERFSETRLFNSLDGKGFKYHTYHDIGTYTLFPPEQYKKLFPYDFFGDYLKDDYRFTKTFALMCREDGLRLAADFSCRTLPHERNLIDYKELIHKCAKDTRLKGLNELVRDEDYFRSFYYDFCLDLIEVYKEIKYKDQLGRQVLEAASIFDSIVSILVRSLNQRTLRLFLLHKSARKKIMKEFLERIKEEVTREKIVPINMSEILITLSSVDFNLDYADLKDVLKAEELPKDLKDGKRKYTLLLKLLQRFGHHLWRPKSVSKFSLPEFKGFNTGGLLWGERGRGKSQTLAYLGCWAHDNNWATIFIPSGYKLVRGFEHSTPHSCGLYMQPEYAQEILIGIQQTNKDVFANLPVDMSLYGKHNLAGWHDSDPPPFVPEYDSIRKALSHYRKILSSESQLKALEEAKAKDDLRLADRLPEPKTLLDIANFGVSEAPFSTVCIAEILEQLYNSDKCNTLIAFDDYNEWLTPFSKEQIAPYNIALVRMFIRFDGHLIRNGVKMTATTEKRYFNHSCTPELINFPKGYAIETSPLALDDFRKMCEYYNVTRWRLKPFKEWEMRAHYMGSQGNWYHFQHSIKGTTL